MTMTSLHRGWRVPVVCRVAGVTYRQLDYWATTGLVEPTVQPADGSGTSRLYSVEDIVTLTLIRRLLDVGLSLQRIRHVIGHVRDRWPLRGLTLASNGYGVWRITEGRDLVVLLTGGRGLFTIAVDPIYDEIEAELDALPSEPAWSR